MRERGLKPVYAIDGNHDRWSLPVRERGLKQFIEDGKTVVIDVAPRAGAWIETF